MTEKNEALRLADALLNQVETNGDWSQEQVVAAAAELRRLSAVEAQRDALVRVLKDCEIALRTVAKDNDDFHLARHQVREIRAAIKAVEGEKT